MENKPSVKNTKNEILGAYNKLLAQYETGAANATIKKVEAKAKENKVVLDKVSNYTVESITKELVDFKLKVGSTLTNLSEQLENEANKLPEIRQAITIEADNLKEIHDITVAADTLANLIMAQEEKKTKFETEMLDYQELLKSDINEEKGKWQKERAEHLLMVKERDVKLRLERDREEEAYEYNETLRKKVNEDSYKETLKTQGRELKEIIGTANKDLLDRDKVMTAREKIFSEFEEKVASFPTQLNDAVKKAAGAATGIAESKAKTTAQLLAKDVEGKTELSKQKILTLEATLVNQDTHINEMSEQLQSANSKVQAIAVQVISGVSDTKALNKVNEIAMEQAKNVNTKR
jgi:hypothetical protein